MDEQPSRSRSAADEQPRSATAREWEVFLRETAADPLQHVGSVTAPSAAIAHEQAEQLFDRFAREIWLCPADTVRRYSVAPPDPSNDGSKTAKGTGNDPTTQPSER
ncbi:MAG: Htur_1727 family rSAM-partnered candidate RiPP [Halobacteriales archaeon]